MQIFVSLVLLLSACGDDSSPRPDAGAEIDAGRRDASGADAGMLEDATTSDAGGGSDAGLVTSDASVGDVCVFNRDCAATQRCGCDEGLCLCETGARGTGESGIDSCTDENDCATALCVEGSDGSFYCSGPCESPADCGPALPVCLPVTGLGSICARSS